MRRLITFMMLFPLNACSSEPTDTEIVGSWTGYVENFAFDDGTDTLSISIATGGESPTGTVVFGDRALYAPPTDASVGYPQGWNPYTVDPDSGFAFTMMDASYDGERLRFGVAQPEIWADWCSMQTPIADEANIDHYGCLPNWGYMFGTMDGTNCSQPNPVTMQDDPVDCAKLHLCAHASVCNCTANGCAVHLGADLSFDVVLEPPEGEGSVSGLGSDTYFVRLQH